MAKDEDQTGDEDIDNDDEVPEGAALMPLIPPELGISPLFLAMIHSYIFFEGTDVALINEDVANENLEYLASYLQRLQGADLRKTEEDLTTLVGYAKQEKWPTDVVEFLQNFLEFNGVGEGGAVDADDEDGR
jgi:hypothetical protein